MSDNLEQYAHIPLKQLPNRVWRTYEGGALIDKWKSDKTQVDGSMPEEWIMSTITARGKNRPLDEGLSIINTPSGKRSLKELVDSNLDLFLGKKLAEKMIPSVREFYLQETKKQLLELKSMTRNEKLNREE